LISCVVSILASREASRAEVASVWALAASLTRAAQA
jgi:hypothetical protein